MPSVSPTARRKPRAAPAPISPSRYASASFKKAHFRRRPSQSARPEPGVDQIRRDKAVCGASGSRRPSDRRAPAQQASHPSTPSLQTPALTPRPKRRSTKASLVWCGRMRRADHGPEAEILPATHRGGHMAAAHVKRKHATLRKVGHPKHLKPQAMKAFPSVVGLLPFVSQVAVGWPESFREIYSKPQKTRDNSGERPLSLSLISGLAGTPVKGRGWKPMITFPGCKGIPESERLQRYANDAGDATPLG